MSPTKNIVPNYVLQVRVDSMQTHLKQVCQGTVFLDQLLDESTEGLLPENVNELLDTINKLDEDCYQLIRRARTLVDTRVATLAAPEFQD